MKNSIIITAVLSVAMLAGCGVGEERQAEIDADYASAEALLESLSSKWTFGSSVDELKGVEKFILYTDMKDLGGLSNKLVYTCDSSENHNRNFFIRDLPYNSDLEYFKTLVKVDDGEVAEIRTDKLSGTGYFDFGYESFVLRGLSQMQDSMKLNLYRDRYDIPLRKVIVDHEATHQFTIDAAGFHEANNKIPEYCRITKDAPNKRQVELDKLRQSDLSALDAKKLEKCTAERTQSSGDDYILPHYIMSCYGSR